MFPPHHTYPIDQKGKNIRVPEDRSRGDDSRPVDPAEHVLKPFEKGYGRADKDALRLRYGNQTALPCSIAKKAQRLPYFPCLMAIAHGFPEQDGPFIRRLCLVRLTLTAEEAAP